MNYPEKYARHGYAVFERWLPTEWLSSITHEMAELFAFQVSQIGLLSSGLHRDGLALLREPGGKILSGVERYVNAARMTQDLPSVHQVLTDGRLVAMAKFLGLSHPVISTKASVHIMADDLAVPGGYHRSPPHQDWRSNQGSLDNLVLWIPLTPVRGNGLEVIRGSHKYGLLPTTDHMQTPEVVDPERLGPWEKIDCDPGDVVAFSSFLVHRTAAGPGLRIAISTRFNNAVEPSFVKRGFPSHYRTTQRTDVEWNPNADHFPNRPPDRRSDGVRGVPAPEPPYLQPGAQNATDLEWRGGLD